MKLRNLTLLLAMDLSMATAASPRYIFYFIGDGMGMGQAMAAQTYNRVALKNDKPLLMMQFPTAGILTTYSASSTVTDSAAAGTALSCGKKTKNGMLGMTPDTVATESMAEVLHNAGWGVGLVTSVAPDDATPGAFYAHVPSRSQFYQIGRQAAESGYEFIAGSTWRGFPDGKGGQTDLADYIKSKDIDLVTSINDARSSKKRRVFLHSANPFSSSNMGFTIDSIPGMLTLPEMTAACIDHLKKVSPDRFVMMVEGGNIDHVGHGNDGATVAVEVVNFNEALAKAYEFYLEHPDETVIIVTADHETGGMSIGNGYVGYTSYPQYLPYQRMSKDQFSIQVKKMFGNDKKPSWDELKKFTADNTGLWNVVPVSEDQEKKIRELYDKTVTHQTKGNDEKSLYASYNALASTIYRILNTNQGFGWTTGNHTGNPVPVYAIGKGMEIFGSHIDNTEIAPALLQLAGYGFTNRK